MASGSRAYFSGGVEAFRLVVNDCCFLSYLLVLQFSMLP